MQIVAELLRRAVLAVIGLPALIACVYFGGWWLLGLVGAVTLVALGEYYSAAARRELRPRIGLGYLSALALLAVATFVPDGWAVPTIFVLVFITMLSMLAQCGAADYQGATASAAVTIFGVAYVGLLMSFLIHLQHLDLAARLGGPPGLFAARVGAVLLIILPVWTLDTFAFTVGKAWGRRQLAPVLSPGKTVEGALAGFLSCVAATMLIGLYLHLPWQHGLALGALLGVLSQLGDLAKSTIKRDLQLDDFGSILGPHGGVLDRFDGLLATMPVGYLYLWLAFFR